MVQGLPTRHLLPASDSGQVGVQRQTTELHSKISDRISTDGKLMDHGPKAYGAVSRKANPSAAIQLQVAPSSTAASGTILPEQNKVGLDAWNGLPKSSADIVRADQNIAGAIGKVVEAILKTPKGSRLIDLVAKRVREWPEPAKIIVPIFLTSEISGLLAGVIKAKTELPVTTTPDIPLFESHGVKVSAKLNLNGRIDHPTGWSITLMVQKADKKKEEPSETEKIRAEIVDFKRKLAPLKANVEVVPAEPASPRSNAQ